MTARSVRRCLALLGGVLLASGCQVATDVEVAVQRNGSGTVSVTVVLDREAASRIPDLPTQLRTDDLRRVGWRITGPDRTAAGGFRVVARKAFARPDQAGAVIAELTGQQGPLRDFAVTRSHSFARTAYGAEGTVDLSAGLASFSDPRVAALLDGRPFGRTDEELRSSAGRPLADAAPFAVTVRLPSGGGRRYPARLGGPAVPIRSRSTVVATGAYVLLTAAVLALVAAVVATVLAHRWRDRVPRRLRGVGVYSRTPYETLPDAGRGQPPGTARRP